MHETGARNSVRHRHLLKRNSELSKGIFEEAKGLLMNRPVIDLWTKQSLIMCGGHLIEGVKEGPCLLS